MNVTLNIECIGGGYVAIAGAPINATGTGPTIGEAIEKLGQRAKLDAAGLPIPDADHPWLKWAGTLPDDELTQAWLETIKENRLKERERGRTIEEEMIDADVHP